MNPETHDNDTYVKTLDYVARSCDCCGSVNLHKHWLNRTHSSTRTGIYHWSMQNCVCNDCGFCFVSPCPTTESLTRYYQDSYQYWGGQALDFEIDKRIQFFSKYINRKSVFVEIGGNNSSRFAEAVAPLVSSYCNIEVNSSCDADHESMQELNAHKADLVASYFVLEHIPTPGEFLQSCAEIMSADGTLILEVPDLSLYPRDPSGLYWWEHVNHFTVRSLGALVAQYGFRIADCSYHLSSRSFGFALALKRSEIDSLNQANDLDILHALGCLDGAIPRIESHYREIDEARNTIKHHISDGRSVVIFGANKICLDLLIGIQDSVTVVDDDPEKKHFLDNTIVSVSDAVPHEIEEASLFVITTPGHAGVIKNKIQVISNCHDVEKKCIVLGKQL